MKGVALVSPKRVKQVLIPKPLPLKNSEVLIKPKVIGLCGSDIQAYSYYQVGKLRMGLATLGAFIPPSYRKRWFLHKWFSRFPYEQILGHEFSGEIIKIGDNNSKVNLGDRVVIEPLIPCHKCPACRAGYEHLCFKDVHIGFGGVQGALAEYITVPSQNIYTLSSKLSYEEAAFCDPLAVALHAVKRANLLPSDTVSILGAGTIGMIILQIVRNMGLKNVVITDVKSKNLEIAETYQPRLTINVTEKKANEKILAEMGPIDKVFECVGGIASTFRQALDLANMQGTIVIIGSFLKKLQFYSSALRKMEVTILASSKYTGEEFNQALKMLTRGEIEVKPLITHKIPFSQAQRAFKIAYNKNMTNAIKVQVIGETV